MSEFVEKIKNIEFTGLNRAFGKGKHSAVPNDDDRGISGGPQRSRSTRTSLGRGFDDDPTSRLSIVVRSAQIFVAFIAMCIYAANVSFQEKWKVGVSFGIGLSLFFAVESLLHSIFFLAVPLIYEKYDRLKGAARATRQVRVNFIINGSQVGLLLIASLLTTISAYTAGCSNVNKDPNAKIKGYTNALPGFCRNKRAGAAFFWFNLLLWGVSLALTLRSWWQTRKVGPRIPGFDRPGSSAKSHPVDQSDFDAEDEEDDDLYDHARGPFADPKRSNSGGLNYQLPPIGSSEDFTSEVMHEQPQFSDPYDGIRQSLQLDHR